jgi:hypothetical protein
VTSGRLFFRVGVLEAWQAFWFREIPPQVYALLRIALGLVGLIGLLALTPVDAFWPASGILPEPGGGFGLRQQLQAIGAGDPFGYALYGALLVSFTCMTIGYRATLATAAAWALTVLQARWNPLPLAGSHRVLICVLFPLLWAHCGRVLSIDAMRRRGQANQDAVPTAIWPLRLIRFQIAVIYLNSGLSKLLVDQWRDGTAVHYAVSSNLFHRLPAAIPPSLEPVATAATYLTLVWEIAFGVMLLHPWTRRIALIIGIALHVGMGLVMELGTFSLVMLASYVAFLNPERLSLHWITALRRAKRAATERL